MAPDTLDQTIPLSESATDALETSYKTADDSRVSQTNSDNPDTTNSPEETAEPSPPAKAKEMDIQEDCHSQVSKIVCEVIKVLPAATAGQKLRENLGNAAGYDEGKPANTVQKSNKVQTSLVGDTNVTTGLKKEDSMAVLPRKLVKNKKLEADQVKASTGDKPLVKMMKKKNDKVVKTSTALVEQTKQPRDVRMVVKHAAVAEENRKNTVDKPGKNVMKYSGTHSSKRMSRIRQKVQNWYNRKQASRKTRNEQNSVERELDALMWACIQCGDIQSARKQLISSNQTKKEMVMNLVALADNSSVQVEDMEMLLAMIDVNSNRAKKSADNKEIRTTRRSDENSCVGEADNSRKNSKCADVKLVSSKSSTTWPSSSILLTSSTIIPSLEHENKDDQSEVSIDLSLLSFEVSLF